MTLTIHLGVVDVPYAGGKTTGDVAQILEDKYHIMEVFYESLGRDVVQKAIDNSIDKALINLVMGKPTNLSDGFASFTTEMDQAFKHFLSQQEMDGVVGGVPTQAALNGVNHRLKHPYAKSNPERPSFIDTGTYESHYTTWVEAK